jgi:translocation and assembly module TamB
MARGPGLSVRKRGLITRVSWWLGGAVLALSAVLAIVLLVLFRTEVGRSGIVALAKELASQQGLALEIGSLGGALPFEISLNDVRLADDQGAFLSLDRAAVEVEPWALLEGRLALESVVVQRITLERLPNIAAEAAPETVPPSGGGGLPVLPIAVRALSVKPLTLGAAVFGEAIALEISANTTVDPAIGIDAGFAVQRLDGDGRIEGRLESDASLSRLKASIRGEAAPGGLISRLIGLPNAPGVTVTLEGDGPVDKFVARYAVTSGEALGTEGEIQLSSLQPLAMTISGWARAAVLLPPELRSLIGDSVEYGLGVSLNPDNTLLKVIDLQVTTAVASANGALKLRLDDLVADGRLSLALTRPGLLEAAVPGLRAEGGGGDVSIIGPVAKLGVDAKAWINGAGFQANGAGRIEATVKARLAEIVEASVIVTASGLDLPEVPDGAIGETITSSAKVVLSGPSMTLSDIRLRSGPAKVTGDAALNLKTSSADFSLRVSHDAVGGLAPVLDQGRIDADVHGRFDGRFLGLQLGGQLADIAIGDPNLAQLTSGSSDLWLEVQQISPSDWRISELEIDTGRLRLEASGTASAASGTGKAEMTLRIPELGDVDPTGSIGSGGLTVHATIMGGADAADIDWRLALTGLTMARLEAGDISIPKLDGAGALHMVGAAIVGDLVIAAETPLGRADASTKIGWDGGALTLSELRVERGADILAGDIKVRAEPLAIGAALDISIPRLEEWSALAGLSLQGGLGAAVELSHGQDRQRVGMRAAVTGVRLDKGAAAVERIEFTGTVDDALGTPVVEGKIDLAGLVAGAARARTFSVAAVGPLSALQLEILGNGAINDNAMRIASASTLRLGEAPSVTVDRLALTGDAGSVTLKQPARITLAEGRAELETLSLALFGGALSVSGRLEKDRLSGSLSVERVALAPIAGLAGLEIEAGQLDAKATVSGTLKSPNGVLDLVLDGVKVATGEGAGVPASRLEIGLRLDAGSLDGKALLAGLGVEPLVVTLKSRIPEPGAPVPVDARALWKGDLGTLTASLPLDGYVIDGDASIDLIVKGAFDPSTGKFNPRQTSGGLTISDGRVEHFLAGTVLDPLQVDIGLDGTRVVIRTLEASDTGEGILKIAGSVDLAEPARPDVNLDLTMEAMTLVRRDDAEVVLDARIAARSVEDRIKVAGSIDNRNIDIRLIGNLPAGVEELKVEEVGDGAPAAAEGDEETPAAAGPPIDLDVKISAPDRIFLRGRGLDSEWGAVVQISGTAGEPLFAGTVAPVRGSFEFAGRNFTLGTGGVTLAGGLEMDPRLGLSATHAGKGFTASVGINGTARKPEIALSSDPSYPEDEILALIIFGRSKARLSAVEVLQLAQSTRALLSGEAGTLDTVRKTIGVDVLTFAPGASESDAGRLKAGKYLRDDVYVGVEQGITAGSSRSVIEWSMTPNVTVEGTVGGSANPSTLGIQRRWEY